MPKTKDSTTQQTSKPTPSSSKSTQKWNLLKHGVIWAQKVRTSVCKLGSVDDPVSPDMVRLPSLNRTLRDSFKKRGLDQKDYDGIFSNQKISADLPEVEKTSTDDDVKDSRVTQSAMVKSPSFGEHLRSRGNSGNRVRYHTSSEFEKASISPVSPVDDMTLSRTLSKAPSPVIVYEGPWTSKYDPLPSPLLESEKMALYHLSVSAEHGKTVKDESLQRNESSQSLESEACGDQDVSTSTVKNFTDGAGAINLVDMSVRDPEQVEAILRRGRRRAIIDEKNLIGDSENESQDGQPSGSANPKNSETASTDSSSVVSRVSVFRERQQRMLRKQNTIADLNSRIHTTVSPQEFDSKRRQNVFMKLIERRSRSKESLMDLSEALQRLTPSLFQDHYLESYRNSHWSQLEKTENQQSSVGEPSYSDQEIRRREAVWELFKSELIFFMDHLMVLKNCFMEPLKKLQVDGYLMFVEPSNLFGNLDDLCYVSHTLCRELIGNLTKDAANKEFGSTNVLLRPLKRWSEHSKDGEVYHSYCLNYDSALSYLDSLRKLDQFNEFEKWCEQDPRCRRLQLTDLLVAPMQHYMKIPLLLASIRRYTADANEREVLTSCLSKVENSLKSLEDKMRWLKNFERLQEIQAQLIWPSLAEMEPRVFIPELLRQSLSRQPCERLIANPKRQLLHEGFLTFSDGSKIVEIFAFLFDDFLLITRIKKHPKKKSFSENTLSSRSQTEGGLFVVYRQAIALDRFTIHDLGLAEANANGLRHAFVLVLITRFQQITGVYTLQAANELDKTRWIEQLRESQQMFQEKLKQKLYGMDSEHQTNKHSKLLMIKHKDFVEMNSTEESTADRELYVSVPSRASSASPSSKTRGKTDLSEMHSEVDRHVNRSSELELPTVQIDECQQIQSVPSETGGQRISEEFGTNKDSSGASSPKESKQMTKEDSSDSRMDSRKFPTSNRHSCHQFPAAKNITMTETSSPGGQLSNTETTISTNYFIHSGSSPLLVKHVPETKVEFLYSATGQSPFSPPLSPTLHAPCASLPSAITLPSFYDYPVSNFVNQVQQKMNELRINPQTLQNSEDVSQSLPTTKPT